MSLRCVGAARVTIRRLLLQRCIGSSTLVSSLWAVKVHGERSEMSRVSLRDVAARAGVSIKTVSNVVNGYAHVSEAMRTRVQAVLDEMGYLPNLPARRLRTGRSGIIALALPTLDVPYFAELAGAVFKAAERHRAHVLVEPTGGDRDARGSADGAPDRPHRRRAVQSAWPSARGPPAPPGPAHPGCPPRRAYLRPRGGPHRGRQRRRGARGHRAPHRPGSAPDRLPRRPAAVMGRHGRPQDAGLDGGSCTLRGCLSKLAGPRPPRVRSARRVRGDEPRTRRWRSSRRGLLRQRPPRSGRPAGLGPARGPGARGHRGLRL